MLLFTYSVRISLLSRFQWLYTRWKYIQIFEIRKINKIPVFQSLPVLSKLRFSDVMSPQGQWWGGEDQRGGEAQ